MSTDSYFPLPQRINCKLRLTGVLDHGPIDRLYYNAARYKWAMLPQFSEFSLNAKKSGGELRDNDLAYTFFHF
jgi:hypothetical protein